MLGIRNLLLHESKAHRPDSQNSQNPRKKHVSNPLLLLIPLLCWNVQNGEEEVDKGNGSSSLHATEILEEFSKPRKKHESNPLLLLIPLLCSKWGGWSNPRFCQLHRYFVFIFIFLPMILHALFTAAYNFLFVESSPSYDRQPVLGPSLFSVSSGQRKLASTIPSIRSAH